MKALKFYDKEGLGFELYMDYEKESIMVHIGDGVDQENELQLELDENDVDEIIIALVDLKNELASMRNFGSN